MDKTLLEALRLRALGLAPHWLRPRTKVPLLHGWATAPVMTEAELVATYRPGYNVGIRAGKYSVVGGKEVCVLDVDVRGGPAYAAEAYAVAEQLMGDGRFDVITGSGTGRHRYMAFPIGGSPAKAATTLRQSDVWIDNTTGQVVPPNTEGAKAAWTIELLSTGKNVVAPPSIHPDTNQPYEWV